MQNAKECTHPIHFLSLSKLNTPEECMEFYAWAAAAQTGFNPLLLYVSKCPLPFLCQRLMEDSDQIPTISDDSLLTITVLWGDDGANCASES